MRQLTRHTVVFLMLFLVAACSGSESATDETSAATEPPVETLAETTTEAPATTTAPETTATASTAAAETASEVVADEYAVDEAMAPSFVAAIREAWALAERTVGGTAPDLSDDEIVAIGVAMCEHLAANPLGQNERIAAEPERRMVVYSELATIAAEPMGISYDPAMQDAGFESGFEARLVSAFRNVALCDPGGLVLFYPPWSVRASS